MFTCWKFKRFKKRIIKMSPFLSPSTQFPALEATKVMGPLHTSWEIFYAYVSVCLYLLCDCYYRIYTFLHLKKQQLGNMTWKSFRISIERTLPFVFLLYSCSHPIGVDVLYLTSLFMDILVVSSVLLLQCVAMINIVCTWFVCVCERESQFYDGMNF